MGAKGLFGVYGAALCPVTAGAHFEAETVDEDLDARAPSKAGSAVLNGTRANLRRIAGTSGLSTLTAVGMVTTMSDMVVDPPTRRSPVRGSVPLRIAASAMMLGAVGWLVAGVVLAVGPSEPIIDRVHVMLIPAVMVVLLVGSVGLHAWLRGFRPRGRRRWAGGLASGLQAMSSQRHRAVSGAASGHDQDTVTARGLGLGTLWLGAVGVIIASQLVASSPAMRSTLSVSWILFFAGTMILGLAVISAAGLPRWAGWLLAIGSLLVFASIWTFFGGSVQDNEFVSPLLGADGQTPVLALLLWSFLGAGWAWLGAALRLRTSRSGEEAAGSGR